ncbi:MAG: Glycerate 2-kinase [Methanocella sp. PtaU1.Bin125]|nr:MAG: Glycerate 2-kinase [Methanocella sp. PtaU1.Bin125]
MRIRDRDALVRGGERRAHALAIIEAGISAVLPENVIRNAVKLDGDIFTVSGCRYDLSGYRHVFIAGGGKASGTMAAEMERLLDGRIAGGIVIDRYEAAIQTKVVKTVRASHPLPDESGVRGMRAMRDMLKAAGKGDLVVFLISGGGSALMPCPAPGVTLEDITRLTDMLLKSGATIAEINCVRKHLSQSKGGRIPGWTGGADVLSLIVSDVVGDDPGFIASGPTAPDDTTYADALSVLEKYRLTDNAPPRIVSHIKAGVSGNVPETPKPGDPAFDRVTNVVIASGIVALKAAARKAESLGYCPVILGSRIKGESKDVGLVHAGIAAECLASGHPAEPPAAILSGGETTVTVHGRGKGGRNQEFVLGYLRDYPPGTTVISVDTDGIDGATDACGAIADETTLKRAAARGLSVDRALDANDAAPFFQALGDLVYTGPTGTNVSDLRCVLVPGPR